MFKRRHFLLMGSICMVLLAGCLFTFSPRTPVAHAAYSEACPPGQSDGSNDTWVQVLQFALNVFPIPNGPLTTDGQFGKETKAAVEWYQNNVMMITDGGGAVGDRTWSSLGFCTGFNRFIDFHAGQHLSHSHCPNEILSNGSNGIWVQALQQALNMDAATGLQGIVIPKTYNGDTWWPLQLDGQFRTQTEDAVKALQSTDGIQVDGVVGPQTWNTMLMCY
jgi:lysozyme family protein